MIYDPIFTRPPKPPTLIRDSVHPQVEVLIDSNLIRILKEQPELLLTRAIDLIYIIATGLNRLVPFENKEERMLRVEDYISYLRIILEDHPSEPFYAVEFSYNIVDKHINFDFEQSTKCMI